MFTFNWLDYFIIGIILISALVSIVRGFVREALSLITWVTAFWLSFHFVKDASENLEPYIHQHEVRYALAFAGLFVATLVIGAIFNMLIGRILVKVGLGGTDRMIGMAFGITRGVLVVSALIMLAHITSFDEQNPGFKQSRLLANFTPISKWLEELIPETILAKQDDSHIDLPDQQYALAGNHLTSGINLKQHEVN